MNTPKSTAYFPASPRTQTLFPCLLLAFVAGQGLTLEAAIKPNNLFTDHMVLQREKPVPIWGSADPSEKVSVTFGAQTKTVEADAQGQWRVTLDAMPASSEPRELIFKSAASEINRRDVLVGEVWICSGQSNMERKLGLANGQKPLVNWEQEVASANYPLLRHFSVGRTASETPLTDAKGSWVVCSPETAATFTAVGYYFGRDLLQKLKVPVGLIHSSWGGTPAEAWTAQQALEKSFPQAFEAQKKAVAEYPEKLAKYKRDEPTLMADWEKAAADATAAGKTPPKKPSAPSDPATASGRPSVLYNGMIAPLVPFAIRGVIWYQGEANSGRGKAYQTLFPLMISDWRAQFNQGDFPFLFVQIAPHKGMSPEIREAQMLTWKKTPNTAMVVTVDVGDAADIHPARKEPVGQRLALAAEALVYGEKKEFSGPLYESLKIDGAKAVIGFTHVGAGLVANEGDLKGFTIAGDDMNFVPAEAKIQGDQIVVTAAGVPFPKAVRYGWANVPDVNLFNKEGLPASPFRTDQE